MQIPANYVRLFSDDRGETHFEDCSVDLESIDPESPTAIYLAKFRDATNTYWGALPPGVSEPPHPTPRVQLFCVVKGECEATTSDGDSRRFRPGDVIVLEDVSGKGHQTAVVGDEDLIWFGVALQS